MIRRATGFGLLALALATLGCAPRGIDATYGRSRGASVNGTGALAELFRRKGHEVRVARRLNPTVGAGADVLVRFAPWPGPPDRAEADWYQAWAAESPNRRLIYVPRDFDAQSEYWAAALARLPASADPQEKARMERQRDQTRAWAADLPSPAKTPADVDYWFATETRPGTPAPCKTLSGPWADGIDAAAAGLTRHQVFRVDPSGGEDVLLEGDGHPLALEWLWAEGGSALVVANGSFLLNEPLAHPARRPLALRVVRWAGEPPRRVVFVEGGDVLADEDRKPPRWPPPLNWVMPHLLAFGLVACLSRAEILGRPRPEAPSGADRPVAHAVALGVLL
ncbi:MAG TPA: DUF4350 domain-containing protein, partial [Isosphaeraceae bacterium]